VNASLLKYYQYFKLLNRTPMFTTPSGDEFGTAAAIRAYSSRPGYELKQGCEGKTQLA